MRLDLVTCRNLLIYAVQFISIGILMQADLARAFAHRSVR